MQPGLRLGTRLRRPLGSGGPLERLPPPPLPTRLPQQRVAEQQQQRLYLRELAQVFARGRHPPARRSLPPQARWAPPAAGSCCPWQGCHSCLSQPSAAPLLATERGRSCRLRCHKRCQCRWQRQRCAWRPARLAAGSSCRWHKHSCHLPRQATSTWAGQQQSRSSHARHHRRQLACRCSCQTLPAATAAAQRQLQRRRAGWASGAPPPATGPC
jgi:hypothetical protein